MSRWLSPLMAFCLSFLLITTLAPVVGIQKDRQLDFWALWLVLMVVLALPFAYLEVALVKRAKTTALQALMSLTREADVSARWRIAGWLAVVFMPFLLACCSKNVSRPSALWLLYMAWIRTFARAKSKLESTCRVDRKSTRLNSSHT